MPHPLPPDWNKTALSFLLNPDLSPEKWLLRAFNANRAHRNGTALRELFAEVFRNTGKRISQVWFVGWRKSCGTPRASQHSIHIYSLAEGLL